MKSRLIQEKHFIILLISTTSHNQAQALLQSAQPNQVNAISEIVKNIRKNSTSIPKTTKKLLSRHSKLFQKLSSKKTSEKKRFRLVVKHWKLINKFLKSIKLIINSHIS